ncbi:hypothetical protein SKAU_G00166470 [Synaphobranchus kaupii]|uniref:Uncharacterized protein n=1 Tax=Synaphobranchus kaupii TaxID=118154 RepID=A0A9Q1J0E3_SYNKA|nr:hypothetical protein SKAU_G00166470 [Synaphobranchus kaupii]
MVSAGRRRTSASPRVRPALNVPGENTPAGAAWPNRGTPATPSQNPGTQPWRRIVTAYRRRIERAVEEVAERAAGSPFLCNQPYSGLYGGNIKWRRVAKWFGCSQVSELRPQQSSGEGTAAPEGAPGKPFLRILPSRPIDHPPVVFQAIERPFAGALLASRSLVLACGALLIWTALRDLRSGEARDPRELGPEPGSVQGGWLCFDGSRRFCAVGSRAGLSPLCTVGTYSHAL